MRRSRSWWMFGALVTLAGFSCAEGVAVFPDNDGDGFDASIDCDDNDPNTNLDAPEICDGKDNNCNGVVDEDAVDMQTFFKDEDGDGWGVESDTIEACSLPEGYAVKKGDCNDKASNIYPGAPEDCSLDVDMNCDGSTGFSDQDGDGYAACDDCDDNDPSVNPGATEICDGIDNDCDGLIDTNDIPVEELCGPVDNGTAACAAASGCVVASCNPDYYDANDDAADGCECLADPLPITAGGSCLSAINLGTLSDVNQDLVAVTGNGVPAGREIWYVFLATDDFDTNGDEFHVDVRFNPNPGGAYQMHVYRNGCPGTGTELANGEIDIFDWYTDQNFTTSGCTIGAPCGEGNCVYPMPSPPTAGKNVCSDNTATFYVKVSRTDAAESCDSYTLEFSNGIY
jgi:hypothetical protein